MIFDLIGVPILTVLQALLGALPVGSLDLPVVDTVLTYLAKINSVIPISGPLSAALGMLSLLVAWVGIRVALMIWHALPFT